MVIVLLLCVAVLAAALLGMLVLMRVGMCRERRRWLTNQPPTRAAGVARAMCGLHVRMPGRDLPADDRPARCSVPASRATSFVA